jgi:hypothetical protein
MNPVLDEPRYAPQPFNLTFDDYASLDPRIGELLEEAKAVKARGLCHCSNAVWFGYGRYTGRGFKPRVKQLAGFYRGTGPALLQTSAAYDAIYHRIYSVLPACRSCGCL